MMQETSDRLQNQKTVVPVKASDLLLPKNLYHKNASFSAWLLRFRDRFIDGYGRFFYDRLHELDELTKQVMWKMKQQDMEIRLQNQTIVDFEAQQALGDLQIKITGPLPAKEQACLQPMQRQFCIKTLNKLGVKRFNLSARHLVEQRMVYRVSADSKINTGNKEQSNYLKRKATNRLLRRSDETQPTQPLLTP